MVQHRGLLALELRVPRHLDRLVIRPRLVDRRAQLLRQDLEPPGRLVQQHPKRRVRLLQPTDNLSRNRNAPTLLTSSRISNLLISSVAVFSFSSSIWKSRRAYRQHTRRYCNVNRYLNPRVQISFVLFASVLRTIIHHPDIRDDADDGISHFDDCKTCCRQITQIRLDVHTRIIRAPFLVVFIYCHRQDRIEIIDVWAEKWPTRIRARNRTAGDIGRGIPGIALR